ncbi:hypothetical protein FHT79_002361 [Rhizobium sp. BK212]|uniref:Uncharacterized protein n=1 Tax=Rhizobium anhuiense TaxID=1184720 RepID=A0A3S0Q236_9HYPH|nr:MULTISPECIES: hypothetical protein [Rhizobium]MBB4215192.1 hypothetical protein [Rhizobium sp. BK212]RUL96484.1 hypothetical protein EEQ99_30630 [Rhizobium anhuiense]GGE07596.1 hypothetical protein GCM10008012_58150 [Rhizobium anhuiense]
MNTADHTTPPPLPTVASLSHATPQETSLYAQFARPCLRTGGWETLSRQYLAMKDECAKRGLRACTFSQFREVVRRFNKVSFPNRCSHPYGYGAMAVSRGPKLNLLDLTAGWRWASKSR